MRGARAGRPLSHPGRVIAVAFGVAVLVGTVLLSVPAASQSGERADFVDALFTATSAVCITGPVTVDTGTHWSRFGQVTILALIQAGGLGIMTLATLVVLLLSKKMGLRARSVVQAETKAMTATDIRRVIRNVVLFSLGVECVVAAILVTRLHVEYGQDFRAALYNGIFHSISAFNNGGFSLYSDSLVRFVADPWVTLTIAVAVIVGGLGFPVWFELARSWRRPQSWTVLTRVTLLTTGVLLLVGTVVILGTELTNPATLGRLGGAEQFSAAFFAAVMPRSGGFNTLDMTALRPETLFVTNILMFIGGGSAGTAGGIKVTTFGLLGFVIWSEMRGEPDVRVGRRRVPAANHRQALAIALLSIGVIVPSTFLMLALTGFEINAVLFETISAFATVGLSTGITPDLPASAKLLLVALMFIGRIGPLTVASALAVRERPRLYQLPEERTIVG